jgi:hypothetical protein
LSHKTFVGWYEETSIQDRQIGISTTILEDKLCISATWFEVRLKHGSEEIMLDRIRD